MKEAKLLNIIEINDVDLYEYQHPNGKTFAVEVSFVEKCITENKTPIIPDPYSDIYDEECIKLCHKSAFDVNK